MKTLHRRLRQAVADQGASPHHHPSSCASVRARQPPPSGGETREEEYAVDHDGPSRLRLGGLLLLCVVLEAATGSPAAVLTRNPHGCGGYRIFYHNV